MTPKVSIIIVNYNHKYFPKMCVEAIERSQTDFEYEIIVVDNGSIDESLPKLRELQKEKRIQLIESKKNLGYGQANNLGVEKAKGEFVIISNPDIFVKEDTMQKLVDYLEHHSEIGLLGPRLRYYNGEIQESCRRHMTFFDLIIKRTFLKKLPRYKKRLKRYLMHDYDHKTIQEVELITGAYFVMKKDVYEEVKGFDPRFFLFMEDYDLCLKLIQKGYKIIYFPLTEAEHYHKRLSSGSVFHLLGRRVFWIHVSSALKYFWKWRHFKSHI
ncbi:glycosyltransferase family 2 protein [Candidatus Peregrinibacteria bacterium]|jgi:N-acetylglucosaminyl-diphospho-decaprenol L-rhamnosyltransferase|nr:glycosyltransferase family 2 protein [Candidatus Peregrinibacteria bacterium]MBT7484503.1 glycosyltransferase family 2 protein [Candidatus Peregrinibacteria bacterium]MBT7703404.1 glycosyltransferase family 2 protein [Candidatus Peregrinibacteria bacterium]